MGMLTATPKVSHGPFQKIWHRIDNPVLKKINHVSNDLYAELKKSSTYSHTCGNSLIHKSSLKDCRAIGLFFCMQLQSRMILGFLVAKYLQKLVLKSHLTAKKIEKNPHCKIII
jgi:hypothetical protein